MKKIEKVIREREEYKHHFYCDDCNKYLGVTEEYDDGYYEELGKLKLSFHLANGWYGIDKHFCEECRKNYLEKLVNSLKELGFKNDW